MKQHCMVYKISLPKCLYFITYFSSIYTWERGNTLSWVYWSKMKIMGPNMLCFPHIQWEGTSPSYYLQYCGWTTSWINVCQINNGKSINRQQNHISLNSTTLWSKFIEWYREILRSFAFTLDCPVVCTWKVGYWWRRRYHIPPSTSQYYIKLTVTFFLEFLIFWAANNSCFRASIFPLRCWNRLRLIIVEPVFCSYPIIRNFKNTK